MAKKSKQKWQHFLPQMYLRGFLDPYEVAKGQHVLWVYQPGAKPISRGPKGVAAHAHFYTANEMADDPNVAEDALAQIDKVHKERPPLMPKITPEMIDAFSR